jgi:hypothetical protein
MHIEGHSDVFIEAASSSRLSLQTFAGTRPEALYRSSVRNVEMAESLVHAPTPEIGMIASAQDGKIMRWSALGRSASARRRRWMPALQLPLPGR